MSVRNIRRAAAIVLLLLVALTGCRMGGDPYLNLEVSGQASFADPKGSDWGVYGTVDSVDVETGELTVDATHRTELDPEGAGPSETVEVDEEVTFQVGEALRRCGLYYPEQGFAVPLDEFEQGATVAVFGDAEEVLTVNVEDLRYCVVGD